ncbi:MAG: hypothetical protein OEW22_10765, partial [Rubrivivax sp.]|nr:hypothetical protein [Rubrivivax sp.]
MPARHGADFASVPMTRRLDIGDPAAATLDTASGIPDSGTAGASPQKGNAPAAGCAETITWKPVSPPPIDVHGDNAVEFAANVDALLGAGGHTNVGIDIRPTVDGAGKMSRVGLTVESSIIRPRWAGGRASDADRALIKKVEAFIKAHEERHRDLSRSVCQQAVCDALGQPVARAESILKAAICDKEPAAQEALDQQEGQLDWVKDTSGAV